MRRHVDKILEQAINEVGQVKIPSQAGGWGIVTIGGDLNEAPTNGAGGESGSPKKIQTDGKARKDGLKDTETQLKLTGGELTGEELTGGATREDPLASSVTYLKREDVRNQAATILSSCAPCTVRCVWKQSPGLVYLVMLCEKDSNLAACLNFWPCSKCACISYKALSPPAEPGSKEYDDVMQTFG